jgi:four helix bundle protein
MEKKIKTYRDLNIWNAGIELVKDIYRLTEKFPKQEMYGIVSQMRRSAISIPSNVVEGFKRFHNKEYRQFLYITLGSCAELETQKRLDHIGGAPKCNVSRLGNPGRMITSLLKKL